MSLPLLHDAIDLVRLRVAPLEHYRYSPLQLLLVLLLLGTLAAAGAISSGARGEPANVVALFTLYVTLETLGLSLFMRWWLSRGGERLPYSLFGLILACSGLQILDPLTYWLPDDVSQGLSMVLGIGNVLVLVNALTRCSGRSRGRVLLGILLFSPLSLALLLGLLGAGSNMGIISIPDLLK
ncbi:hypothetical protein [Vogesella sp. LIG4]|uniref:hypothetical protein n=1 Tax=Vogesella sp. LIG4 TaxID=1192162 RepID=UPI00081FFA53|nr:hypothetical protein [Vogesella sp. LIG4]SCK19820.1 hypothetical protein PSELUDRAFT_2180 [Vogesella sp. LIG4]